MAVLKQTRNREVPIILDGNTFIKTVTKNTTCADVINKLPNLETPLAVFENVDGVEKELTGKTKLLKVWRAHGSSRKVEFVIRKSLKMPKMQKSKVLNEEKKSLSNSFKSAKREKLSKDTLKQVSDLAFYVRYQKTKVQALRRHSDFGGWEQKRLMKRMTSNASVNSMDAFLAKADLSEMSKFLSFCGQVTTKKLCGTETREDLVEADSSLCIDEESECETESVSDQKRPVFRNSFKAKKLGLKQRFASKCKTKRTISTGTINSTDTGYQSVGSEVESEGAAENRHFPKSDPSLCLPDSSSFVASNLTDQPRHSTPVFAGRIQMRRASGSDSRFTRSSTEKLECFDEIHGKTLIFQKFMADQTAPVSTGNDEYVHTDANKTRRERYSLPASSIQKDVCRFYWNQKCYSDSDSESESSQTCETLDVAFNAGAIEANDDIKPEQGKLRRVSACSNLNSFSFLSSDDGFLSSGEDSFDYSIDCSFPRMDESLAEAFSFDFTCDFDESDSDNFDTGFDEDNDMHSFMNTRSFLHISTDDTAECQVSIGNISQLSHLDTLPN